jgi:hypothetical protein
LARAATSSKHRRARPPWPRRRVLAGALGLLTLAGVSIALAPIGSADPGNSASAARALKGHSNPDGLGITPGKVKHVWLIILEN